MDPAPDTAARLAPHFDEIVCRWSELARSQVGGHYAGLPVRVLHAEVEQGLRAVLSSLESGGEDPLVRHVDALSVARFLSGFAIREVIEGFLLCQTAALPYLLESGTAALEPQPAAPAAIEALEERQRRLAGLFAERYAARQQEKIESLYADSQRQLAESRSLGRVTASLLAKSSLDEVLRIVCEDSRELIGALGASVLLQEEDGWLTVVQKSGVPVTRTDHLHVQGSLAGLAILTGEPVLRNHPLAEERSAPLHPDVESLLAVPLLVENIAIGALDVANKPGGFLPGDVAVLTLFAGQAAVAIEHARLMRRAEEFAVMEERQRLGRELHDSVSQALYSLTLYANAAALALSAGRTEVVTQHLRNMRETSQEAMRDMRLLVFELHPPLLEQEGLAAALQARLAAVETRAGLHAELHVEGEERLPLFLERELYGIAQEALNNVLKHAGARTVHVGIQIATDSVAMQIQDDGVGFDRAEAARRGGLGLRSMSERALRVGGVASVDSRIGEGTAVVVRAPRLAGVSAVGEG